VGDAATAAAPVRAVGCGWAFRSAERLVDAAAPALLSGADLEAALGTYTRAHRFIDQYDLLSRHEGQALSATRPQRRVRAAAVRKPTPPAASRSSPCAPRRRRSCSLRVSSRCRTSPA
jgi:2-polyprenyl-6-methoxyphenol hydroxylase-like FAD-dependent oxidoreductase